MAYTTSGGGSKIRSQGERLKYFGARLGTADCLFQKLIKNLRGQGSGLSTCQAKGGPHAPEEPAPPPTVLVTVGFRVIIHDLVPSPEVTLSLVVGKEIQQKICVLKTNSRPAHSQVQLYF